jgi:hypothetical protein
VLMTNYSKHGTTMLLPAAYSAEPAERPGERIHAGLCREIAERKHVVELSDAQFQEGSQPFSVDPELQICPVAPMGSESFAR